MKDPTKHGKWKRTFRELSSYVPVSSGVSEKHQVRA